MASRWKYLGKALNFIPVIAEAIEAMADGKLEPNEIVDILDEGFDAAGIKGLDNNDIYVEDRPDGGFSVNFSAKAKSKLSVKI